MIEREELRGHLDNSKWLTAIALAMLTKIDKVFLDVCRHYKETNSGVFKEYDLIHQLKCCALFAYVDFCEASIGKIKEDFEEYALLLSVQDNLESISKFKNNHSEYDKLCYYYALSNPEASFEVMYQYWYESVGEERLWTVTDICKEAVYVNKNILTLDLYAVNSFEDKYSNFVKEVNDRLLSK